MHIFISYAKVDTYDLAIQLRDELRKIAGVTVWMDERLEPGESWAHQIQTEIDSADYVIVLLSSDVNRPVVGKKRRSFVLNEIDYAQQVGKAIIPIMAQSTVVPVQLAGVQYIDFTTDQSKGTHRLIRKIASRTGIALPDTPSTLDIGGIKPSGMVSDTATRHDFVLYRRLVMAIIVLAVATILIIGLSSLNRPFSPTPTSISLSSSESPNLDSLTASAAPTFTPSPSLEIAFIVQTLDSQATIEQANQNAQSTDIARATAYALATKAVIDQTATATRWTATPTPNITASIEAYRTQQAATATANFLVGQTATATLWTSTPTSTTTPTDTLTPTRTFIPTSTFTLTPIPLGFPGNPVTKNMDWTPQYQTFDGFEMAFVPVGCFMMGSNNGYDNEKPVNRQCFDQPFWIDRYEVTNKQYGSEGKFKGDNRPRDSITWVDAHDFCSKRDTRLPTEREWEYAARGPSNLIYPWGNEFIADNVIYSGNSNNQSADVGSQTAGNSWVGASDLSGNLWEWISSIYQPYPYKADDGREDNSSNVRRVIRGGAWNFYVSYVRAAVRDLGNPTNSNITIGFRCAHSFEP